MSDFDIGKSSPSDFVYRLLEVNVLPQFISQMNGLSKNIFNEWCHNQFPGQIYHEHLVVYEYSPSPKDKNCSY